MTERLREKYITEVRPSLMKDYAIDNELAAPRIVKVTVNSGIGSFRDSKDAVSAFKSDLTQLLGQVPHERRARKSIAAFKLREGQLVGLSATLRGDLMWAFLDKLITVVLPRVRDFRGISREAFDSHGNYSIGLTDHSIFPEVDPNKVKQSRGLQINIVVVNSDKSKSLSLLDRLGFPFSKE